jgi:hypothetical protein
MQWREGKQVDGVRCDASAAYVGLMTLFALVVQGTRQHHAVMPNCAVVTAHDCGCYIFSLERCQERNAA